MNCSRIDSKTAASNRATPEALKSEQKISVSDFEIDTPHNGVRTVTSKKLAIFNEDGHAEYVLSITDRKFAEDALRQTQTFLDTVIEHAPSPIVVRDAQDYRYLLVNRAAEELFDITREKIIGKTAYEILPMRAVKMIAAHDKELVESAQKSVFLRDVSRDDKQWSASCNHEADCNSCKQWNAKLFAGCHRRHNGTKGSGIEDCVHG